MKKRISVFLISILLCLACAFPVWAGTVSRLDDQAGLLDAEQQESLSSTLDEISERDQVDVVVVTVNSLEGKTAQAYAMILSRRQMRQSHTMWKTFRMSLLRLG